jgi:hypothetical protein
MLLRLHQQEFHHQFLMHGQTHVLLLTVLEQAQFLLALLFLFDRRILPRQGRSARMRQQPKQDLLEYHHALYQRPQTQPRP